MWLGWAVMITPGIKLTSQQPKPCHANHPTGPLQVLLLKGLALSHPAPLDTPVKTDAQRLGSVKKGWL